MSEPGVAPACLSDKATRSTRRRAMGSAGSLALLSAVLPWSSACGGLSSADRDLISTFVECHDCIPESRLVVGLGEEAVPHFSQLLLNGPSAGRLERRRAALEEAWAQAEGSGSPIEGQDRESFIQGFLANFVAQYRVRSAWALGRLGGGEATAALCEAAALDFRDDVLLAVTTALDTLGASCG